MSKVAIFHTSAATLNLFQGLCAKIIPDVEVMHLVEDSMIREVMKNGGPTAQINARIANYVKAAEYANCSIFMTACSSIGASVENCQPFTDMLVTRIDEAMIESAINLGKRIAVLATVETTLKPTLEFINRKAVQAGKTIELMPNLMAEAFVALLDGDHARHDSIVSAGLKDALGKADVVVLAQASMARVMEGMATPSVPVLTSPEAGVLRLKEKIGALSKKSL